MNHCLYLHMAEEGTYQREFQRVSTQSPGRSEVLTMVVDRLVYSLSLGAGFFFFKFFLYCHANAEAYILIIIYLFNFVDCHLCNIP